MHLPFIAHTHTCQMYVTIMCMRLKHAFRFISNKPLRTIEQANQEFRQGDCHSQHVSNA